MKVNLLVSRPAFDGAGEALHVDTFDLYQQRPRAAFAKQAATELGVQEDVVKADLGKILLRLEALQAERIEAAQAAEEQAVALDGRRNAGGARAAARSRSPLPHRARLHALRRRGRDHEQARRLPGRDLAQARRAARRDDPVDERRRQVGADGRGAGLRARRGSRQVLGDDGPVALLHGRDGSPAQGAGASSRRRARAALPMRSSSSSPRASSRSRARARTR